MIIDHGKIVYAEKEPGKDVTVRIPRIFILRKDTDIYLQVSSAESVLAKL